MKTLRTTMMCGVAAATMLVSLPALAAECEEDLRTYGAEIMERDDYRAVVTPRMQSDLRHLRNSVRILAQAGQEEACQEVVEAIREMTKNPEAAEGATADYETWHTTEVERLQSAKSLTEVQGRIRVEEVIGADVRNHNNEDLGEIDDIILAVGDTGQSYAIISEGGFLGIGEEQIAVPFDKLKVTEDMDVFVLNMSEEEFENAPKFERGMYESLEDEEWQKKNRDFFQTAEGAGTKADGGETKSEEIEMKKDESADEEGSSQ